MVCAVVGVPLIFAVVLLDVSVNPAGKAPLLTIQVKVGPRPPLTERVWL